MFVALILASEIGDYRYDKVLYAEVVEALSNQYYGETKRFTSPMQCRGRCDLYKQILWATQMEAIYGRSDFAASFVETGYWRRHIQGARDAVARNSYGADSSWFWGNVDKGHLVCYDIVVKRETNTYPGKPYFIVYAKEHFGCNP